MNMRIILRTCMWTVGIVLMTSLVVLFVCNRIVTKNAEGKVFYEIDSIKHNKVGLLLGTIPRTRIGNHQNFFFTYRIQAAIELYKAGKIEQILVSGAEKGPNGFNEPRCMKDSLIAYGIPENAIILDGNGCRTIQSVINAKKEFGLKRFTIISQQFHNERAIYQAEHLGMNIEDLQAYNAKYPTSKSSWIKIREYFARVRVFYDLFLYGIKEQ